MIRRILLSQLQPLTRAFVTRWRIRKHYPPSRFIDITDCFEILNTTPAAHTDSILSGTYNRTIELHEMQFGWDGEEPLTIMIYYVEQYIKDRINGIARTLQ